MVAGLAASIQNRRVVDLHELRRLILSLHSCECPDSERLACIYPGNKLDYICLYPHSGSTSTFMERHQRNQRTQGLLRAAFNRHCTDIIRKPQFVYVSSVALFTAASAIVASSKTIGLVIGMRGFQAAG